MKNEVILWGGVGNKLSNNNTQWYQQNRIYDANGIALCLSASEQFNPWYLVIEAIYENESSGDVGFERQTRISL